MRWLEALLNSKLTTFHSLVFYIRCQNRGEKNGIGINMYRQKCSVAFPAATYVYCIQSSFDDHFHSFSESLCEFRQFSRHFFFILTFESPFTQVHIVLGRVSAAVFRSSKRRALVKATRTACAVYGVDNKTRADGSR